MQRSIPFLNISTKLFHAVSGCDNSSTDFQLSTFNIDYSLYLFTRCDDACIITPYLFIYGLTEHL